MNEVAGLDGPNDVPLQSHNSPQDNVDYMDVDDDPKLVLQDTIIYRRNGTIANLFDSASGLQLRAEGTLWVDNAERYKFKRPNGTQCQVEFQKFAYERDELGAIILYVEDNITKYWVELKPSQKYIAQFTVMVESAELKHFITDYYERVLDGEVNDDLQELCWEYARQDGCGLLQDEVIEVLTKDSNSFFLATAFREEIWVDAEAKAMRWSRTEIYKLVKNECPDAYKRANTNFAPDPEPMAVDPPIVPDLPLVIKDRRDALTSQLDMLLSLIAEEIEGGTPVKKITPSLLWNKLYIKAKIPDHVKGAGARIAKCLVYKIGGLLAGLLEQRQPDLFVGSKLVKELREVARTPYPPYTKSVTSDAQWQDYMDRSEGLYLVRRNLHHSERGGALPTSGPTKFQVKDIFTGELAPARPIARVGTGRVGRPPKARDTEAEFYYGEEEEDQTEIFSGVEAEAPLTVAQAWQRVWELGGEDEIIGGRVVPARIKRAAY
ncbi:hypothetical protein DSL72_009000 [Monilinia vaccinii-corymbosi]|uniref:Uncharacterized protein n=1 Tax=Monilinia vaccinii-corymbosi TaxID=61207 RepID=A0A8A3PP35_9HELO|nr:hypothetical protein DSL72_009000 [Monilinia vaccinii-corymbosi]